DQRTTGTKGRLLRLGDRGETGRPVEIGETVTGGDVENRVCFGEPMGGEVQPRSEALCQSNLRPALGSMPPPGAPHTEVLDSCVRVAAARVRSSPPAIVENRQSAPWRLAVDRIRNGTT